MENSLFLAKILGPYITIIALAFLFNPKLYQKILDDFCKNSALIYLSGVFAFLFGLLIVLFHHVWVSWPVVITVFGWVGLIKGIWLIIFPNTLMKFIPIYQRKTSIITIGLIIALFLGVLLIIKGYGLTLCSLNR